MAPVLEQSQRYVWSTLAINVLIFQGIIEHVGSERSFSVIIRI